MNGPAADCWRTNCRLLARRRAVGWYSAGWAASSSQAAADGPTTDSGRAQPSMRAGEARSSRGPKAARGSAVAAAWEAQSAAAEAGGACSGEASASRKPGVPRASDRTEGGLTPDAVVTRPGRSRTVLTAAARTAEAPKVGAFRRCWAPTVPRVAGQHGARAPTHRSRVVCWGVGRRSSRLQTTCSDVVGIGRRCVDSRNDRRDGRVFGARAPQHDDGGGQQEQ